MVTRHYKCQYCEYEELVEQRMSNDYFTQCPHCENPIGQIYYVPTTYVYNDPKTIGLMADRNNKAMGRQKYEETLAEHKQAQADKIANRLGKEKGEVKKPAVPFWRNSDKVDISLATMTPEKKRHYIETGEK